MSDAKVKVPVFPVPSVNWFVLLDNVIDAKVGVAPVCIFCGSESVIDPVAPETLTWLAVPASESTPLFVMLIVPAPFETLIPEPLLMVPMVYPDPFPIRSCPFDGVPVTPVPPFPIGSVPVTSVDKDTAPNIGAPAVTPLRTVPVVPGEVDVALVLSVAYKTPFVLSPESVPEALLVIVSFFVVVSGVKTIPDPA